MYLRSPSSVYYNFSYFAIHITGGRYDMQHRPQRHVLSGKRHQEPHKHHRRTAFVQVSSIRDTYTLRSAGRNGLRTLDQRLFVSGRGIIIYNIQHSIC